MRELRSQVRTRGARTRQALPLAAVAAVMVLLAGCSGSSAPTVALTGAGATFPYPLYSKWFDAYHQKTGVQINYQSIGSGGGIQQVKAGTVDFGATDAPLDDARLGEMPRAVIHIPTVAGAVALAYNLPDRTEPLNLTPDALAGIYLGQIKKWNDPLIAESNPGASLPDRPILPVYRSDGSGTTFLFTSYLASISEGWKEGVGVNTSVSWPAGIGGKGNEGVSGLVRQTEGAIGYVELAYAKQNGFSVVRLRNASGAFVEPTLESTTAAANGAAEALAKDVRSPIVNSPDPGAYPIAGLTFLLIEREQPDRAKGGALVAFMEWAMSEGQDLAAGLDYARLPESVVAVNRKNLGLVTLPGAAVAER